MEQTLLHCQVCINASAVRRVQCMGDRLRGEMLAYKPEALTHELDRGNGSCDPSPEGMEARDQKFEVILGYISI